MTSEMPPDALAGIREFADQLDNDPQLAERFVRDPGGVLAQQDLDIRFPAHSGFTSMGQMIANLDEPARLATIRSIAAFTHKMVPRAVEESPDVLVFVFAVANANAAANANAGANANAAANANAGANANAAVNTNTNTSGMTHLVNPESPTRQVSVFEGYPDSAVARTLNDLQLTHARQIALLKRAALDGDLVTPPDAPGAAESSAEHRVTTYRFQGRQLTVESRVTDDEVVILGVSIQ